MLSNLSANVFPITVGDVVRAREGELRALVCVDANKSVADAIAVLGEHGLVSAPVMDSENGEVFIGLVNMLEMFVYADLLTEASKEKLAHPVKNVLDTFPDALNLWRCDMADALDKVLIAFRKGVHRVLVFDETHPVASGYKAPILISQSDVIKYINNHPELVPADQSVANGLGFVANEKTESVLTVSMAMTAAEAFRILADNDMSAAPIVDEEGRIDGTISASDLRRATPETNLNVNVMDFLEAKHARGSAAPVSVGPDAMIGEVMIPLSYAGVHRVWVVCPATKKPVGVVSMTDVIDCVCRAVRA